MDKRTGRKLLPGNRTRVIKVGYNLAKIEFRKQSQKPGQWTLRRAAIRVYFSRRISATLVATAVVRIFCLKYGHHAIGKVK